MYREGQVSVKDRSVSWVLVTPDPAACLLRYAPVRQSLSFDVYVFHSYVVASDMLGLPDGGRPSVLRRMRRRWV